MKDKFQNYIIRSFIWNSLFLVVSIFAMFYLVQFEEIRNWNILFVFIPVLLWAASSETMSKNPELQAKRVKPYSLIDLILKFLVFLFSQTAYRKLLDEIFFLPLVVLVFILGIASYVCEIIMFQKINNKNPRCF